MALEQAIKKLTAAVEANTRAVRGEPVADKPKPRGFAAKRAAANNGAAPVTVAVAYEDVQAAVNALVKARGHPMAQHVLAQFGVTHGKQLAQEQWGAVIEAMAAATAGADVIAGVEAGSIA